MKTAQMNRISANFDFLGVYDPQLVRLAALAERHFKDDPNACVIKLRQFGEVLAQLTAAKSGLLASPEELQADLLRRLKFGRIVPREVGDLFHQLRIAGNRATTFFGKDVRVVPRSANRRGGDVGGNTYIERLRRVLLRTAREGPAIWIRTEISNSGC